MSKDETVEASDLCDGCGACCAPGVLGQGTNRYLEILPEDVACGFRTKCDLEYTPAYTGPTKVRCFLPVVRAQNDFTQCEHLRGRVLVDAICGCYHQRPKACRVYAPGSDACRRLRLAWLQHQEHYRWVAAKDPHKPVGELALAAVLDSISQGHKQGTPEAEALLDSLGQLPDYAYLQLKRLEEKEQKASKAEKLADEPLLARVYRKVKPDLSQTLTGEHSVLDDLKQEAKSPADVLKGESVDIVEETQG